MLPGGTPPPAVPPSARPSRTAWIIAGALGGALLLLCGCVGALTLIGPHLSPTTSAWAPAASASAGSSAAQPPVPSRSAASSVVPAATSTRTDPGPRLTEYGATRADWDATHQADLHYQPGTVYNPGVISDGGHGDQFIEVADPGGRIQMFIEQFNRATPFSDAQHAILAELPADARLVYHHAWADCYQEMFASRTLGRVLGGHFGNPKGLVLVNILAGNPADLQPAWIPATSRRPTSGPATAIRATPTADDTGR